MKKFVALLLIVVTLLTLSACGSKDALAGTWSAELGADGTYTIEGDQLTVTLEAWSDPSTYTFSVDGNSLTMNENSGYGISGTFTKK